MHVTGDPRWGDDRQLSRHAAAAGRDHGMLKVRPASLADKELCRLLLLPAVALLCTTETLVQPQSLTGMRGPA
jgi:hypothetical protein